ncbi:MAG: hypothetical protein AAGI69_29720 [Cyanobacteria bacterium P01_H01_bin.21]
MPDTKTIKRSRPADSGPFIDKYAVLFWLRHRTQRWWAVSVLVLIGTTVGVAQLKNLFAPPPEMQVPVVSENEQLALYTDVEHPLANLGADYGRFQSADTAEKLTLVYQSLERFDGWLAPRLDTAVQQALSKEALRMQQEAEKEAASGEYDFTDPISTFDFSACLATMPGKNCVLLRYAGDGIAMFYAGSEKQDVYQMLEGYARMRAALLALGAFELSSDIKEDVPFHALVNYRQAIYLALKLSPAARPQVRFQAPNIIGDTSPAEAVENAYPQDHSTEPLPTNATPNGQGDL